MDELDFGDDSVSSSSTPRSIDYPDEPDEAKPDKAKPNEAEPDGSEPDFGGLSPAFTHGSFDAHWDNYRVNGTPPSVERPAIWLAGPSVDGGSPASVTCGCCCQSNRIGVFAPVPGSNTRLGRLSDINFESVEEAQDAAGYTAGYTGDLSRLPDVAAVVGPCGDPDHMVCVACIRAAVQSRPDRPAGLLECLATDGVCGQQFGAGVRWCFSPEEYESMAPPIATVVCGCGAANTRPIFTVENTRAGQNMQRCRGCAGTVCFDCGKSRDDVNHCLRCTGLINPPLRPSLMFPDLANSEVTAERVAGRAAEILEDAGGCVRCHHCGLRVGRDGGCKVVTHCGTEVCVECNCRGQRSTGVLRGCCTGHSFGNEDSASAPGRVATALLMLLGTSVDAVRNEAVHLVQRSVAAELAGLAVVLEGRPGLPGRSGLSQALGVGHDAVEGVWVEVEA
jgi:hypothetical protein